MMQMFVRRQPLQWQRAPIWRSRTGRK